jgi:c-di-GMP-specific phosphodiesterase
MPDETLTWDAAAVLAAVGAAETALWAWSPREDRLQIAGAVRALGLAPLAPDASAAALRALVLPQDRHLAEELLHAKPAARFRRGCGCAGEAPASGAAPGWRMAAPSA